MKQIARLSEKVANGTGEIDEMIKNVNRISERSTQNTQNVAAEEQNASMEEISTSAEALSRMAMELQQVIGRFTI